MGTLFLILLGVFLFPLMLRLGAAFATYFSWIIIAIILFIAFSCSQLPHSTYSSIPGTQPTHTYRVY